MASKTEKQVSPYSVYTAGLTFLTKEAHRDGLHNVASVIDESRKKIELLRPSKTRRKINSKHEEK